MVLIIKIKFFSFYKNNFYKSWQKFEDLYFFIFMKNSITFWSRFQNEIIHLYCIYIIDSSSIDFLFIKYLINFIY